MKKVQLVILGIATIMSLTACGSKQSPLAKLERYLEDTYDEDFEYIMKVDGVPWKIDNKNAVSALFTCETYGDQKIKASYSKTSSGEHYADNYMAVKYNYDATQRISDAVGKAGYTDYIVNLEIFNGVMTIDDIKDYTLDTYMKDDKAFKSVDIILNQKSLDETDFENIVKSLVDCNITVKGIIAIPSGNIDDTFDELDRIQLNNIAKMVTFSLENGEIIYETWSN